MKKLYTNDLNRAYPMLMEQLEKYVQYCLRCLHRCNIHPASTDFALIRLQRHNGSLAEAVVYPATSVKENLHEIENPMFFYGFKMDWDFRNLSTPICVTFCNNVEDLKC